MITAETLCCRGSRFCVFDASYGGYHWLSWVSARSGTVTPGRSLTPGGGDGYVPSVAESAVVLGCSNAPKIQPGRVRANINFPKETRKGDQLTWQILRPHDDWANLSFTGGGNIGVTNVTWVLGCRLPEHWSGHSRRPPAQSASRSAVALVRARSSPGDSARRAGFEREDNGGRWGTRTPDLLRVEQAL